MKLLIAGSRNIDKYVAKAFYEYRFECLIAAAQHHGLDTSWITFVSGKCPTGPDQVPYLYPLYRDVMEFAPDWKAHGKSAGPIRNSRMAAVADVGYILWDGKSRGSKNMIEEMTKRNKILFVDIVATQSATYQVLAKVSAPNYRIDG